MQLLTNKEKFKDAKIHLIVTKDSQHNQTDTHCHEFHELVYISSGTALHSHDGHIQILTAGDLFIIFPGEQHAYIKTNNTTLYNCLFTRQSLAGFESDIIEMINSSRVDSADWMGCFSRVNVDLTFRQQIVLIFEQINWEMMNRPLGWILKCKTMLIDLLVTYTRLYSKCESNDDQKVGLKFKNILTAVSYIEHNFNSDITVEDIAKAADLSIGYLSRQFTCYLGTSPSEYVRNYRMAKAADFLRGEELSVATIAKKLGFKNTSLFSRQFRQVTGISPTMFRKNLEA